MTAAFLLAVMSSLSSINIWSGRHRDLHQRQQSRILDRGRPVYEAGEIGVVTSEGHEGLDGVLLHEHRAVPSLALGANQDRSAFTKEQERAAALGQIREGMGYD